MENLKDFVYWIVALLLAAIAFFLRREGARLDEGLERIGDLERASVTHEQLDTLMERMTSERAAMHIENREHMQRIEDKLDTNKKDSADSHKELRDELHELALRVATKQ